MHLFIQNNLASVLPRTAKHLPMIHVCTVHRAGIRPDPNYCTGRKWEREREKKTAIKLDGLPASIAAAYLQNT